MRRPARLGRLPYLDRACLRLYKRIFGVHILEQRLKHRIEPTIPLGDHALSEAALRSGELLGLPATGKAAQRGGK